MKRITPDVVQGWVRLYLSGKSIRDIEKQSEFGRTAIREHLIKEGVEIRKTTITSAMEQEWAAEYQSGLSVASIASKCGVDDETIRMHLKKLGMSMRPVGGRSSITEEQELQWARMYDDGHSVAEIAKATSYSVTTIATHLRKRGVKKRTAGKANQKVTMQMMQAWREEYLNGSSTVQIGDKYGFSSTTVSLYLNKNGVDVTSKISEEDALDFKARYDSGDSLQEIAAAYDVSDTSVRNHLKRLGVNIARRKRGYIFDEEIIADWIERYDSGESLASIAFSAGVKSADTIRKRLVENGVQIRRKVSSSTSSSWPEWAIYFYIAKAFPECAVENNACVDVADGVVFPDVLITGSNIPLSKDHKQDVVGIIIEYDGEFWHSDPCHREKDVLKTRRMTDAGYLVLRVIENSAGNNSFEASGIINCTMERGGNEVGLGYAITTILRVLGSNISVDLAKDKIAITRMYLEARNKTRKSAEWAKLYEKGISAGEIAARYGVTPTTVSNRLKNLGIKIRHQPHDDEEKKAWREGFDAGMSVPDISRKWDVDKGIIYRYLNDAGVAFERCRHHPDERDYRWKELYESNRSMTSIAAEFGTTSTTVGNHLRMLGVKIRELGNVEVTPEMEDGWERAYNEGATLVEIANRWETSATTVRSRLIKRGVTMRNGAPNKLSDELVDCMISMYENGEEIDDIAADLRVSKSAVRRRLQGRGINLVPKHSVGGVLIQEWIDLYDAGYTLQQLSRKYGFAVDTISKAMRNTGKDLRPGGTGNKSGTVKCGDVDAWVKRYCDGDTLANIARQYGVSQVTVSKHLKKRGVELRKGGRIQVITPDMYPELLNHYCSGETMEQLRARYGVSANCIYRHLKRASACQQGQD